MLLAAAWWSRAAAGAAPALPLGLATAADISSSLSRGAAWIWPGSNGPLVGTQAAAPYREAAVLVESMLIRQGHIERSARTRPYRLPAGARLLPVLHVEAAGDAPDALTPAQQQTIVAAALRLTAESAGSGWLQLDFEAPARQRQAYAQLVAALRAALPPQVRLSVTALAHWCTQGDWLDRLAADEVVPMLYRLGRQAERWRERFVDPAAAGLARRCRGPAMGFATNDPPPVALLHRVARPYWFDESAWSNPSHPPPALLQP
ncbi:MAG: hypothetical protein U1E89_05855 [Burkholderiaceae bacterium]